MMAQFSGYFAWRAMEAVEIEQFLENSIIVIESIASALRMKMYPEVSLEMEHAFMPSKRLRTIFISPP
jgi:hypothetical protein